MTRITKIDRKTCGLIAGEIEAELQEMASDKGIDIKRGRAKYSDEGWMEVTIRVMTRDESGNAVSPEAAAFKKMAQFYDMKPEDLGREFRANGKTFTITGLNTSAPKYPIVARCKEDGKSYRMTKNSVTAALARA